MRKREIERRYRDRQIDKQRVRESERQKELFKKMCRNKGNVGNLKRKVKWGKQ